MIERLGIQIGCTVIVSKRGDIIPKIERVIASNNKTLQIIQITVPTICPCCSETLKNIGTRLYCENTECNNKNSQDTWK